MANRYAPLVLPSQLDAMPIYYQSKIFLFDATGQYIAQQHVNKMYDFFELHDIDEADVQMRFFAQTLSRDVKKRFKAFLVNHIADLANFHRLFIDRWEKEKTIANTFWIWKH